MSLAIWLHAGRVHRQMSIEEVARVTKIQQRILERIESGRFDGLPADVFVRGFVRAFARAVALDENEALRRYSAIGTVAGPVASPAARALVETMSDLAPGAAGGIRDVAIGPVVLTEAGADRGEIRVAEGTMRMAAIREAELVAAAPAPTPVIEVAPPIVAEAAVVAAPKKPRRKRKTTAVVAVVEAAATETVAEVVVETVAPAPKVRKPRARKKTTVTAAIEIAATVETAPVAVEVVAAAEVAPEVVVSDAIPEPVIDELLVVGVDAVEIVDLGVAASEPIVEPVAEPVVEPTEVVEPWSPKMPTVVAPMPPWRRPTFAVPVAAAPSLVIDDADPDSAERELEDRQEARRAERTHSRRSFLPPILLDREDRTRQGGLTLAVIILLIAATLTLSYLMRRPSSSGDGVTRADRAAPTLLV